MELRARIAEIIEQVGEGGTLDDETSEQIADRILALPEIRDGRQAMEAIARQGLGLLDDGSIGREYKARS